jgi:hypothetical protein
MAERLKYARAFPEGVRALLNLERPSAPAVWSFVSGTDQDPLKTRASQMNKCAYSTLKATEISPGTGFPPSACIPGMNVDTGLHPASRLPGQRRIHSRTQRL